MVSISQPAPRPIKLSGTALVDPVVPPFEDVGAGGGEDHAEAPVAAAVLELQADEAARVVRQLLEAAEEGGVAEEAALFHVLARAEELLEGERSAGRGEGGEG